MRWLFVTTIGILFALGCVMIFGTTSAEILDQSLPKATHVAFFRQLSFAVVGFAAALWISRIDYHKVVAISPFVMCVLIVLLCLCFVPGVGKLVNGSYRWVTLLGVSFQPSELVKVFAPLCFLHALAGKDSHQLTFFDFLRALLLPGIAILLILVAPSHSTVGLIGVILVALCYLLRVPNRFWLVPLAIAMVVVGVAAAKSPYVRGRLQVYVDPERDILGRGHQPHQAKIAAGAGRVFGRGIGKSLQKMSYLPEAQNDYIAAIYAEEFGFSGVLFLIFLYMLLIFAGVSVAYSAPDALGLSVAAVLTFMISFQAFMNLGVVSGFLPSTGLNLPFFSQGGTSLVANFIAVGILFQILGKKRERAEWRRV